MKRILNFIEKYFFLLVLLFVGVTFISPKMFSWVMGTFYGINMLNLLLSIILFGMGTTLTLNNFLEVFKRPKEILIGVSAQYVIMPLLALSLATLFSLDTALTVGLMLVGTVPGGTASDVITFLAKGDVALSVSMTAVSTVLSPILTPLITLLLVGNRASFDPIGLFISIVQIVIIPIALGLLVNDKLPKISEKLKEFLPAVSSIVICLIIGGVFGLNINNIFTTSWIIILVVILLYCLAILLGFIVGYISGMNLQQMITVSIELAFQNSGLSTSLAKTYFSHYTAATVPGAIYSVWQNFAGSVLAHIFRKYLNDDV